MKKFVVVLALLAFSGTVFAQKIKPVTETREVKELVRKQVEGKQGKELNKAIAELLKVETHNPNVEGMSKGLDHVFGVAEITKKIEFAEKIRTMLEITDKSSQEYKMGFALANLLSRIEKMKMSEIPDAAADIANATILIRNHAFLGMKEAVETFAPQARSVNYHLYKKYDAPQKVNRSAEDIADIGALNVVEGKLGLDLTASKRDGVILTLDGVPADKKAELRKESEFWKNNCKS